MAAPFTLASLLSRAALFPSFVIFCFMTTYGALVAFLAIYAQSRGTNPGIFFLVMAVVIAGDVAHTHTEETTSHEEEDQ